MFEGLWLVNIAVKINSRINPLEVSQPDSAGKEWDTNGLQAFAA